MWQILIPLGFLCYAIYRLITSNKRLSSAEKEWVKTIKKENIHPTTEIGFPDVPMFLFDDTQEILLIRKTLYEISMISYNVIKEYELVIDNVGVQKGIVGRSIVGGIIGGGAGAVIGGTTAKSSSQVKDIALHIYKDEKLFDNLPVTIIISSTQMSKTSSSYAYVMNKLRQLTNSLDKVIAFNGGKPNPRKAKKILPRFNVDAKNSTTEKCSIITETQEFKNK